MKPLTFIIPAYNAEKTISQTVESLAAQTRPDSFKCFVFDDNSPDGTYKELKRLQTAYPFLEVFRNDTGKNRGPGANRNLGIERADTKYIAFIDADDMLEPDWVEIMLDKAEAENLDLLVSGYKKVDLDGNILSTHNVAARRLETYTGSCWARLYRTDFIKEHRIRFATEYNTGEDMMFVMGASSRAERADAIDYIGYSYFIDSNSLSNQNTAKGIQDKIEDLLKVISDVKAALKPEDYFGQGVLFNVMAFNIITYGLNTPDENQFINCVGQITGALSAAFPGWRKRKKQMGMSGKLRAALRFFNPPLLKLSAKLITKSAKKKEEAK